MKRLIAFTAVSAGLGLLATTPARADLVYLGPQTFSGSGLGAIDTVLTLQTPGNSSFAAGSVGREVGIAADVIEGDSLTSASQTQTRSLAQLGLGSASDLRIVFNANEPQNAAAQSVLLANLQLNIFSPSGALLFSSGDFSTQNFPTTFAGIGNSGFVFGLDAAQAAQAQALAFGPGSAGNRIGLSAAVANATGGPESLYVTAVPEPSAYALLLAGLCAIGLFMRSRRPD